MGLILAGLLGSALTVAVAWIQRIWSRKDQVTADLRAASTEHRQWLRRERLRVYTEFTRVSRSILHIVADPDRKTDRDQWKADWRPRFKALVDDLGAASDELTLVGHDDVQNAGGRLELAVWDCFRDLEKDRHPHESDVAHERRRTLERRSREFLLTAHAHLTNPEDATR